MSYSQAILLFLQRTQGLGLGTAGCMAVFLHQLLMQGWAGLRGQDVSESSEVSWQGELQP